MKIATIIAMLPALYFGTATAEEYYQVTSTGGYYSGFSDIETRNKYIDKWYPDVSKSLKQHLLELPSSTHFSPKVADVGILVEKFKSKGIELCIVNIATYNIAINCNDIKPAEKWQHDQFEKKLATLSKATFFDQTHPGFVLGETTTTDILRMERDYGFRTIPAFNPNPKILALDILDYEGQRSNHMPTIKGVPATKFQMQFLDNTLYKLQVEWRPKVKDRSELRALNGKNITTTFQSDLVKRFGRFASLQHVDPITKENRWKRVIWVNNDLEIELTHVSFEKKNGGDVATYTSKRLEKLLKQ